MRLSTRLSSISTPSEGRGLLTNRYGLKLGRSGRDWTQAIDRLPPVRIRPLGSAASHVRQNRAFVILRQPTAEDYGHPGRHDISRGEQDYLDVLTDLIEAYERAHHPIPDLSGPDMLRYLLEERGVSQAEAAREMSMAPSTVSDILRGKRGIGRKHIVAFVSYVHVSPTVFLSEPGSSES